MSEASDGNVGQDSGEHPVRNFNYLITLITAIGFLFAWLTPFGGGSGDYFLVTAIIVFSVSCLFITGKWPYSVRAEKLSAEL